jgi:hypothetical protein
LRKGNLTILVAILVLVLLFTLVSVDLLSEKPPQAKPDVFVGVSVGFGDENLVYKVANAIEGYANLIIIGSLDVTTDTPALIRVCDYLYQRDFSFIIYVGFASTGFFPPRGPAQNFFNSTVARWGDKFLGAYIFDEIGGKQLDYAPGTELYASKPVQQAENYTDAAIQYIHVLNTALTRYTGQMYYNTPNLRVFTSDYGLYWFDYLAGFGYNVVLGEFAGNQSRQLAIALSRGAANAQHMNWGTMITWKYDQAPFLEEPSQLYNDMVLAYENGAKYIVVFNSPDNQTATTNLGILTSGPSSHLDAMKRFWNYATTHPRTEENPAKVAYVLPRDYGFGFRRPDDTIWGIWPADALSPTIWNQSNSLVAQYGTKLDVVYETFTDDFPIRLMYDELIYWNGTIIGQLSSNSP